MPINMQLINALAVAMSVSPAAAAIKGFNYGSTFNDNSIKVQSDFESEFKTAAGLVGAEDFTSARLYTMIVCNLLKNCSPRLKIETNRSIARWNDQHPHFRHPRRHCNQHNSSPRSLGLW